MRRPWLLQRSTRRSRRSLRSSARPRSPKAPRRASAPRLHASAPQPLPASARAPPAATKPYLLLKSRSSAPPPHPKISARARRRRTPKSPLERTAGASFSDPFPPEHAATPNPFLLELPPSQIHPQALLQSLPARAPAQPNPSTGAPPAQCPNPILPNAASPSFPAQINSVAAPSPILSLLALSPNPIVCSIIYC